jgi:hypothetical protein
MKKFHPVLVCAVILFAAILICNPAWAQKKVVPPDYFPLQVGNWWSYKMVESGNEFMIKVTGKEKIGDVECFKVETIASNDKVMFTEYYSKPPGKVLVLRQVFNTANMTADYNPVRHFLNNPLKVGDSWTWKGKGMMDVETEETKKVEKVETVEVPAGKFSAAKVPSTEIKSGTETKKEYWYADHIGLVKSFTDTGSVKSTVVLVKYNVKGK